MTPHTVQCVVVLVLSLKTRFHDVERDDQRPRQHSLGINKRIKKNKNSDKLCSNTCQRSGNHRQPHALALLDARPNLVLFGVPQVQLGDDHKRLHDVHHVLVGPHVNAKRQAIADNNQQKIKIHVCRSIGFLTGKWSTVVRGTVQCSRATWSHISRKPEMNVAPGA